MKAEDQLLNQVLAALYLLYAGVMALLVFQNYRYGLYELVYTSSTLLILFLCAAAYERFAPEGIKTRRSNVWILGAALVLILSDAPAHADQIKHWLFPLGLLGFIALPLRQANVFSGIAIVLMSLALLFGQGLLPALGFAACYSLLIALASAYAKLHQQRSRTLVELAIRDPLTGAYNYRHLEDTLGKELCRADRTGKPLSLIALEIDYFPQLSEAHSSVTTNHLLQQFSQTLGSMIRAGDSQYCDDNATFYLLLPCTPSEGVLVIAERIRRAIEENSWPNVESITVSLGCTSYQSGTRESSVTSFINDADIALVEAQKNGHNRVCHHH